AQVSVRVPTLPGCQAATIGTDWRTVGGPQSPFAIDGQTDSETRRIMLHLVGADYLRTLGIPLRRGRMLTDREIAEVNPVAVINEAAAKLWSAADDPIGRRLRLDLLEKPGDAAVLTPTNA